MHVLSFMPHALLVRAGIVRPESPAITSAVPRPHVISVGEKMREVVLGMPLSLAVNLENAACHAVMARSTRLVFCT